MVSDPGHLGSRGLARMALGVRWPPGPTRSAGGQSQANMGEKSVSTILWFVLGTILLSCQKHLAKSLVLLFLPNFTG